MERILLRGHHLLCSRLFTGNGYSREFVERMGEVVSRTGLAQYRNSVTFPLVKEIKLVCGDDYVCEKCPNLVREGQAFCGHGNEDVLQKDHLTLRYAGLSENGIYTPEEIQAGVERITEEQFQEICGTCRWYRGGYCSYEALEHIRNMDQAAAGMRDKL